MKKRLHFAAPLASVAVFAFAVLALSIALSACASAPSAAPTTAPSTSPGAPTAVNPAASPAAQATAQGSTQAPKYGGTINLSLTADPSTFDDTTQGGPGGVPQTLTNQELWEGDWTKGIAGGYGTKTTDWRNIGYDIFGDKAGYVAQSWKFNVDNATNQATIVYEIRPGVHYALDKNSPASVKVGGRELTADDVLASIKQATTDKRAYIYRADPDLRNVDVSKTGPMEITVKVPASSLVSALSRFGDSLRIYPTELRSMDTTRWQNQVGTGPFMLTNYVPGSSMTFTKNPNFWMKDPIGPGKGNQLPYVDGVQFLIIPDPSTRLTAFRTGKIDEIDSLSWEDSAQLKKEFPQMPVAPGGLYYGHGFAMYMRTDKPPFNDVRVRRALMMATDFNTIKKTLDGGLGQIISFPYDLEKGYEDLYPDLNAPDIPASVKEQFVYSPDKAKQLLDQAGYPNGFTTQVMIPASESSYEEAIASMWDKVGVKLNINVKDPGAIFKLVATQNWNGFTTGPGKAPTSIYYDGNAFNGTPTALTNMSFVNDKTVKDTLPKIRLLAATHPHQAMKLARTLAIRALDQAWAIQIPNYPTSTFWWPWLGNYSGEISVGYFDSPDWTQFVWVDQQKKQSMGH